MSIRVPLAALLACTLLPSAAFAASASDDATASAQKPALTFHALRRDPSKAAGESLKPDLKRDSGLPPIVTEVVAHYDANGNPQLQCDGGHPHDGAHAERTESTR